MNKAQVVAAPYQQGYIDTITEETVLKALKKNTREFRHLLEEIPKKKIDYAYAEGKWTIRQILQHIIDAERVFTYRSLSFARKDATPLPGFEEKDWAANAGTDGRKWDDLIREFRALRKSTECLFESYTEDQWMCEGIASDYRINVLALGFLCSGHINHHIRIIKERYL